LKLAIRAFLANFADGLNTRFSFNIVSMFVAFLAGAVDEAACGTAVTVDM
jgi:hypothetical protein